MVEATNTEFLSTALAELTGERIVPQGKDDGSTGSLGSDCFDSFYRKGLQWKAPADIKVIRGKEKPSPQDGSMMIKILIEEGDVIRTQVRLEDTIGTIRSIVSQVTSTSSSTFRIISDGRRYDGHDATMADLGIEEGDVLEVFEEQTGGGGEEEAISILSLDPSLLAPRYNYDFSRMKDTGKRYERGGWEYIRPYGWNRVALNVKEKYEEMTWLGGTMGGIRTVSVEGEWPVSYHGTQKGFAEEIAASQYELGKGERFSFGRGIYSSPDPAVAEKYATTFQYRGKNYKIILQNRINPEMTQYIKTRKYYITKDSLNIKAYAILYKKV